MAANHGSRSFLCNSTSAQYPSDGIGGATATAASSTLASANQVFIEGILVVTAHTAGTTITIMDHDGSTAIHSPISIAASQACPLYIPLGGKNGIEYSAGISCKVSNAGTTCYVYYRDVTNFVGGRIP